MKKCIQCNKYKSPEEFIKQKKGKNGLGTRCKICHAENMKKYMRQYNLLHPEKAALKNKRYYDKLDIYQKRVYQVNNRAKRSNNEGTITSQEWKNLCEVYNHKCLSCGKSDLKLTIDHIIPLIKGGKNTIDNIQPLCMECNLKKHVKIINYRT